MLLLDLSVFNPKIPPCPDALMTRVKIQIERYVYNFITRGVLFMGFAASRTLIGHRLLLSNSKNQQHDVGRESAN